MLSISQGNILSYEIIDEKISGNLIHTTCEAIISPYNLVSKLKNIGYDFEVNGQNIFQNVSKELVYSQNETSIVQNFLLSYNDLNLFDSFQIKMCEPTGFPNAFLSQENRYSSSHGYPGAYKNDAFYSQIFNRNDCEIFPYSNKNSQDDDKICEYFPCNSYRGYYGGHNEPLIFYKNEFDNFLDMSYCIPISYTPIFNRETALNISTTFQNLFNKISISDPEWYKQNVGSLWGLYFSSPVNEKGRRVKAPKLFYFRQKSTLETILNYFKKLSFGSDIRAIEFSDFTPSLASPIFIHKRHLSPVMEDFIVMGYQYKKLEDLLKVSIQEMDYYRGDLLYRYFESFMLLRVTSEELSKLKNIKIIQSKKN